MDAQNQKMRQEQEAFARSNKQVMFKAFDDGRMSQVFDCLSSGASIDDLILYAFTNNRDLNPVDQNGRTFLHYAVLFGTEKTIEKLAFNGANPLMLDKLCQSPLGLLAAQMENAQKNSAKKNTEIIDCVNKHTDMCSKLAERINSDKEAYLAEQRSNKPAIKEARLISLKKSRDDMLIDQTKFDAECHEIEHNFDSVLEKALAEYADGRDKVRDKMLKDVRGAHANKLTKLNAEKARFDAKIVTFKRMLDILQNAIATRPEQKRAALDYHMKGGSSDIEDMFKPIIGHKKTIKDSPELEKVIVEAYEKGKSSQDIDTILNSIFANITVVRGTKKICQVLTVSSAAIMLVTSYLRYALYSRVSVLKHHLLHIKNVLLNIDFDLHNSDIFSKPMEELCNTEIFVHDPDKQELLERRIAQFEGLVSILHERLKEKYFYHPASYFIEQEGPLVQDLEQVYTAIITSLDEYTGQYRAKNFIKPMFIAGIIGSIAGCYYKYASISKKWGLFWRLY